MPTLQEEQPLRKLIITGANGAGKTHVARQFSAARPDIPLISFNAVKLLRNWQQKPRQQIDDALARIVVQEAWILEGGPSLLPLAFQQADALLWLDPPTMTRAFRLAIRPWRNFGKTRRTLPDGNIDWPLQQYRFAWRSLRNPSRFRDRVSGHVDAAAGQHIWHCENKRHITAALTEWRRGSIHLE